MKCFLDVDGVIAALQAKQAEAHGCPDLSEFAGHHELPTYGYMESTFWTERTLKREFWESLPKMDDADEIIKTCQDKFGYQNVFLLTACVYHPEVAAGRLAWIENHFPGLKSRTILASCKHAFGHQNTLLIDDDLRNVEAFRAGGGRSFLLPRLWNPGYKLANQVIPYLKARLKLL